MAFHIREATNQDTDEVVRIVKAVYDEYGFSWDAEDYHADLYDLEGFYEANDDRFWIALDGEKGLGVVGFCRHGLIPGEIGQVAIVDGVSRAGGSDCSLERLYVHPNGRRRGVGQALTETVIEAARECGCRAMELWSDKRFGDAHRLYGRFGAVTIGERICHDPDQSPEWGLVVEFGNGER